MIVFGDNEPKCSKCYGCKAKLAFRSSKYCNRSGKKQRVKSKCVCRLGKTRRTSSFTEVGFFKVGTYISCRHLLSKYWRAFISLSLMLTRFAGCAPLAEGQQTVVSKRWFEFCGKRSSATPLLPQFNILSTSNGNFTSFVGAGKGT